jgi:hypothetical protein
MRRGEFTENCSDRPPKMPREHLVDIARRLFGPEHGIKLDIPPRGAAPERPAPDFSDRRYKGRRCGF